MRHGVLLSILLASAAYAQGHLPDDLPDAGLPDAAVGETGAERASEEEEDATSSPCLQDRDCDRGFACKNDKCTFRRYRDATFEGCGAHVSGGLWVFGAVLLLRKTAHFSLRKLRLGTASRRRETAHFFSKRTK